MNLIKCPECKKRCKSSYLVNGQCHWCGYQVLEEEVTKEVIKPDQSGKKNCKMCPNNTCLSTERVCKIYNSIEAIIKNIRPVVHDYSSYKPLKDNRTMEGALYAS